MTVDRIDPEGTRRWPKAIHGDRSGDALNIDIGAPSQYRPDERVVVLRTVGLKGRIKGKVAFRPQELRTVIGWLEEAHAALTQEDRDDGDA